MSADGNAEVDTLTSKVPKVEDMSHDVTDNDISLTALSTPAESPSLIDPTLITASTPVGGGSMKSTASDAEDAQAALLDGIVQKKENVSLPKVDTALRGQS